MSRTLERWVVEPAIPFEFWIGSRIFASQYCPDDSGAHPASNSLGNRDSFSGGGGVCIPAVSEAEGTNLPQLSDC
jgi:hypothetical protein